jgi:hypothetical protein
MGPPVKLLNYRRYTQLPAVINMLAKRQLTLLSPAAWDDKNDSYFLERYGVRRGLKSVLALCFTREVETYHHWAVFAPGPSGIRVSFSAARLQPFLDACDGLRLEPERYLRLKDLEGRRLETDELPFVKRYPYRAEREVRLLWESADEARTSLDIPIDLSVITDITLSPWLHPSLEAELKRTLKSIPGCSSVRISRSTLVGNAQWMGRADGPS